MSILFYGNNYKNVKLCTIFSTLNRQKYLTNSNSLEIISQGKMQICRWNKPLGRTQKCAMPTKVIDLFLNFNERHIFQFSIKLNEMKLSSFCTQMLTDCYYMFTSPLTLMEKKKKSQFKESTWCSFKSAQIPLIWWPTKLYLWGLMWKCTHFFFCLKHPFLAVT